MKWRSQRGSTMVETALVLPILLFIVVLGIDLIMMALNGATMWAAAREASRALALGQGLSAAKNDANDVLQMGRISPSKVHWTVSGSGDYVDVELRYNRPVLVPLLPALFGQPAWQKYIEIRREMTFRKRG